MGKYKKLVGNSFIFAVGNLGSKLISFVLVPLYTYYLTTKEYGQVDLVTTTVSLMIPIVSGGISVAVLRFALDKGVDKKAVVTNSTVIALIGILITALCYPLLSLTGAFNKILLAFIMLLAFQIFTQIIAQFARGNGQVRVFAFNGMIKTLAIGLLNIYFLVVLKMGLNGYLISLILAEIISLIYLSITTPYFKSFSTKLISKSFIKEMLMFSVPTIPNDVLWWFVNSASRYFILYFLGVGANGIYAVANKIPSVISMMQSVFSQAWQISLVEEIDSENRGEFHANIFKYYAFLLFFTASSIMVILKWLLGNLVQSSYFTSWEVTPFLLISAIYSGFIGFYGQFYIAEKKTRGLMNTSIISGILSIVLNFVFISMFGLIGVGLASMISLFVGWMIRIYDTSKFIIVKIDIKNIVANHIVLALQVFLIFKFDGLILIILETICLIILLFVNGDIVKGTIETIRRTIRSKK
ncbi:lipopolysaccharide biosynthesis protein [Enterococcus sp.]|uniref:lipopolysaccharide biosynthesis protein n=1 Tax=Enterococcus sp. TaxID=35783 RepID=UPI0029084657|nr:oligosaccharide flippase family protein [Enterococcus sp.]MDU5335240.1 oligosaccharide flippase family protein [Enterococcus sp.]